MGFDGEVNEGKHLKHQTYEFHCASILPYLPALFFLNQRSEHV